ncbi:MAG: glycine cleavage system protein GcvH, partial [Actinobacteria bacterium]|nr:glycine cleavage system protein GcvH [Actinomycetota bacterium]
MSNIPGHLSYTKEHEWVQNVEGKKYRIGITDYAQGALGDIVYVQLPKVGDTVVAGSVCGEVESTKSVSEIYAPVSGVIVTVNNELDSKPETINGDPYGSGWLAEIEINGDISAAALLTAAEYGSLT